MRHHLLIGSLLLSGILGQPANAADTPIRIGVFAPLTGSFSAVGQRFRDAAELAADELAARGGVEGRKIEFVVDDDRNAPEQATAIAKKLTEQDHVIAAIGSLTSTASLAAAPVFAQAKVPQLAPMSTLPKFTRNSDYQFRLVNTLDGLAPIHVEILKDRLKAKRVAIPYYQDDWGIYIAKVTEARLRDAGIETTIKVAIPPNTRDFRPLVTQILSSGSDAIFLATPYSEGALFVKQLRQAGSALPVAGSLPLNNPKFVEVAGKDANGVTLYASFFAGDPRRQAFVRAYEKKFGRPPDEHAAHAYDAINVTLAAIGRLLHDKKELTGVAVRDALAAGPAFAGVTGDIRFDHGDVVHKAVTLLTIQDGEYRLLP